LLVVHIFYIIEASIETEYTQGFHVAIMNSRLRDYAEITPLDRAIVSQGGRTAMTDTLPQQLWLSKIKPSPSRDTRLEELTKENGYLREELAMMKDIQNSTTIFLERAIEAQRILEEGLKDIQRKRSKAEGRLLRYWGIVPQSKDTEFRVI
jgi:hypothetical protein